MSIKYCIKCQSQFDDRELPSHCGKCGIVLNSLNLVTPESLSAINHSKSNRLNGIIYIVFGVFIPAISSIIFGYVNSLTLAAMVAGGIASFINYKIPYGQYRNFLIYLALVGPFSFPQLSFFGWLILITLAMCSSIWLKSIKM